MKQHIWEDIEVAPGKWREVATAHGLSDIHIRALDKRHNTPHIVEGKTTLVMKFLIPVRVRNTVTTQWLNVYLNQEKILTFHEPRCEAMETIRERVEIHEILQESPSGILALIADVVTEQFTPILDYVDDTTDKLVDIVAQQPEDDQLQQLFEYKQLLSSLRRIVLPTMMLLDGLQNGRYQLVDKEYASTYLRDSYMYAWRVHELIDTTRDLITSALDVYLSVVSNRMNEVMKRLTIVATIFMPISFIVGFGGMNFTRQIAFDSDVAFWTIIAAIVLVPAAMLLYFYRKGWTK